jgi:uncharacterized membrane protein
MSFVLLTHAAVTLYMAGLIWFVQVVHYPLFGEVSPDRFASYEQRHTRLTSRVVLAPMLVEMATAIWLVWRLPEGTSGWMPWSGLVLVLVIWLSTFLLQVPQHRRLVNGFDPTAHRRLVRTNWIRTVAWSVRGLVVLGMINATA